MGTPNAKSMKARINPIHSEAGYTTATDLIALKNLNLHLRGCGGSPYTLGWGSLERKVIVSCNSRNVFVAFQNSLDGGHKLQNVK